MGQGLGSTMLLVTLAVFVFLVSKGFFVLREYERGVIFRFGRLARGLVGGNGPGVVIIIPFIDKLVRVSLRTVTMDVPPQDVITKDNVSVKVMRKGLTALALIAATLSLSFGGAQAAADKLKVAAVFETPIEEPWVNQIHVVPPSSPKHP